MEKMNQVSVTEFMSKSKEEMYDMAVEMVEKYNRLVDICNDSAERMAELMAKDGINEFKKELQSKEIGKFKIQKLADVVVWADNWIKELEEDNDIEEFEAVKKVVLESIYRHTVYTNALKNDIGSKDAKIEKLEKEIEGRKECYTALKELVDTKYISIEEHNNIVDTLNKEIERLDRYTTNLDKVNQDLVTKVTLLEDENKMLGEKIRHQKENLDGINKTLEIRTKEKESLISVRNSQEKEIEAHEEENARLSERIIELKKENSYLKKELDKTRTTKELDLNGHNRREMALVNELADKNDEIKSLKEENSYLKSEIKQKQNIIKKAYERYSDDIIKTRKDLMEVAYHDIEKDNGYVGFKRYVKNALIEAEGDKNEANEIITEAVRSAYAEWDKTQKENEKTIKKAIKEVKSKRGTPDIPCGEDAIE